MSVHKKFQPNRSSCLAGYRQHIYITKDEEWVEGLIEKGWVLSIYTITKDEEWVEEWIEVEWV